METDKIVIVKRHTPLEELLVRHSTTSQAKFYLEASGHSYDDYEAAHNSYNSGLQKTIEAIPKELRIQTVDKKDLATFQFGNKDLIVVVGDDGLLVNVAKYVGNQKVVSVNPDEERFDGVLATCNSDYFPKILKKILYGEVYTENLTMAEAKLDDGQSIRALNDLFIGRKTHVSAKYALNYRGNKEKQSSSGIIVSTGTGSTGWMTSVVIGAQTITQSNPHSNEDVPFRRDADYLIYAVREPFPSKITGTNLIYGKVSNTAPLYIESNMPDDGVIFGDGIEKDFIEFTSGRTVSIQPSDQKVHLVRAS